MGKSKRGSGPREGSNRAERIAARKERAAASVSVDPRSFRGFAAEADLIALREFVPSATAMISEGGLTVGGGNRVEVATLLAGQVLALARQEGDDVVGYAGLQVGGAEAPAASLAAALDFAAGAAAGSSLTAGAAPSTLALSDVLSASATLNVSVHDNFNWWFADGADVDPQLRAVIDQANDQIPPTARLDLDGAAAGGTNGGAAGGVPLGAAWWVDPGTKAHLRWIYPADEEDTMNALARVHAADGLTLGAGSRFAGTFRAHGVLVPVFDLDRDAHADEWIAPTLSLAARVAEALAVEADLTAAERRSRDGLRSRQVSL